MESVTVAASLKNTAREFIDNLYFAVFYHVVNVHVVELVRADCLSEVVYVFEVLFVENSRIARNKVVLVEQIVDLVHTFVGERNALALFVELVVSNLSGSLFRSHVNFVRVVVCCRILGNFGELTNVFVYFMIFVCVVFALAADDERCSCFIDEDGVDFVDDTIVEAALNLAFCVYLHVVAQVVEAEFVVRSVCKVACVCGASCVVVHVAQNAADRLTQEDVHLAHPL